MGKIIKKYKKILSIIITLYFLLDLSISIPNVSAPPPASIPDQFISEIFPNSTLPLQLIYTNTVITFNATDFSHKIDINFDANYTIHNPGNTTIIPVIVPFSLAINTSQLNIEVDANDIQIPYDLFVASPWNESMTEIDINIFTRFMDMYPIIFIRSNVSLLKNSSFVLRYQINGSISNPFDSSDLFYLIYHVGTSQEWIGNSTGKVELKAYGKQPVFSTRGSLCSFELECCDLIDINGGNSFRCEWNNRQISEGDIGIQYYTQAENGFIIIVIVNISIYIAIVVIIILVIIIRKNRRKIESM